MVAPIFINVSLDQKAPAFVSQPSTFTILTFIYSPFLYNFISLHFVYTFY